MAAGRSKFTPTHRGAQLRKITRFVYATHMLRLCQDKAWQHLLNKIFGATCGMRLALARHQRCICKLEADCVHSPRLPHRTTSLNPMPPQAIYLILKKAKTSTARSQVWRNLLCCTVRQTTSRMTTITFLMARVKRLCCKWVFSE